MSGEGIGADPFENGWEPGNSEKLYRSRLKEQQAEIEALKHDIERHVCISSQLATENEVLSRALRRISAIEDKLPGEDWEEIREARDIATFALNDAKDVAPLNGRRYVHVPKPVKLREIQFAPYDARALICEAIEDLFGEKCPDFDPGCATCAAWQEWEALTLSSNPPDAFEALSRPDIE